MDYPELLEQVISLQPLSETYIKRICSKIQEIFIQQSNLIRLSSPICVIGDIHGQFYDVLKIFKIGGQVPQTKYLFLGDYVDRGYNSLETILYLFILKIMHPTRIYLTRGNHQSRQISSAYGFYTEVQKKYGHYSVWKIFNQTFDYLPLAAVIEDQIFCLHGGLSPDIHALDQILQIDRVMQIPQVGPFTDLMWSDPQQIQQWQMSYRGAGWQFGNQVVHKFNQHNRLKLIARSHQLVDAGYMEWFHEKSLVTIWSAPNYCYRCGNKACIMRIDENVDITYDIFTEDQKSKNSQDFKEIIPYFL